MHSSSRLRPAAASGRTQNMGRQRPEDRSGALPALGRKGRRGRRNGLIWQVCSDGWGGQDPEKGGGALSPGAINPKPDPAPAVFEPGFGGCRPVGCGPTFARPRRRDHRDGFWEL